jgi:hypothetical protein
VATERNNRLAGRLLQAVRRGAGGRAGGLHLGEPGRLPGSRSFQAALPTDGRDAKLRSANELCNSGGWDRTSDTRLMKPREFPRRRTLNPIHTISYAPKAPVASPCGRLRANARKYGVSAIGRGGLRKECGRNAEGPADGMIACRPVHSGMPFAVHYRHSGARSRPQGPCLLSPARPAGSWGQRCGGKGLWGLIVTGPFVASPAVASAPAIRPAPSAAVPVPSQAAPPASG